MIKNEPHSYMEELVCDDSGRTYWRRKKLEPLKELEAVRDMLAREWIEKWAREHQVEHGGYPEALVHAPRPTDEQLGWAPKTTVLVEWDTGFLVADLEKVNKLPAKQRNAIYKLGGMKA